MADFLSDFAEKFGLMFLGLAAFAAVVGILIDLFIVARVRVPDPPTE